MKLIFKGGALKVNVDVLMRYDYDVYDSALEASTGSNFNPENMKVVQDGVPMQLNVMTQDIMDMNIRLMRLKECDNPNCFEKGSIPTVGGLYSEVVFGTTMEERKKTWGYIKLNCKVIHPFIYETLCRLQENIDDVCKGEGSWKVNDKGELVKRKPDSEDYDEDATGLDWFIENYPKIKFKRNSSIERNERLDLIGTFKPDEILIDKWLVMPVFYRDVESSEGGPPSIPQVTKEYQKLIRYAGSMQQNLGFGFADNMAKYNIQMTLVTIRKYFQSLIEKSDGFFHQYVMGKNPDYGSRSVISCAVLDEYDKPEDSPIDMTHTGIPLSQVCVMLFPFVTRFVRNFMVEKFSRQNAGLIPMAGGDAIRVGDVESMYNPAYIEKQINKWIDNYESRFDPVLIPTEDGRNIKFKWIGMAPRQVAADDTQSVISDRYFTWTDLLYIAAEDVSRDKTVWITRYPIAWHQNTVPTMIHVLSTINTIPVVVDGRYYPYYPLIDVKVPKNIVATSFNDTVNLANLYLSAMNGDYDGDTVSMRCPFIEESNEESVDIINSKKQYLSAQGKLVREVKNESLYMVYNLTSDDKSKGFVSDDVKKSFTDLKPDDIGIKYLTYLFGTTADAKTKKISPPRYYVGQKMHLDAGEYLNKEAVDTTLGRFIFNKIFVEPYNISGIIPNGYMNDVLTGKKTKAFFSQVGDGIRYDKITTEEAWKFLKAFEFYTTKGVTIFAPSYTSNILVPKEDIIKKKEKWFKEHPDHSLNDVVKLEDQLTADAKDMLGDDPGMALLVADARGSVEDNYKVMSIMVGPVLNPYTGEFEQITSDYIGGIKKEELTQAGNMVIDGVYPKACGTAESGYITKQFNAALQGIKVDVDGTDCGTKSYINVYITNSNWKGYEFQNIIEGEKLVPLTLENSTKYFGKKVKMRSPMCCTGKVICSACAGRQPYVMNMRNIGLQMLTLPQGLLEASMKKFHTTKLKIAEVDPNKLLI